MSSRLRFLAVLALSVWLLPLRTDAQEAVKSPTISAELPQAANEQPPSKTRAEKASALWKDLEEGYVNPFLAEPLKTFLYGLSWLLGWGLVLFALLALCFKPIRRIPSWLVSKLIDLQLDIDTFGASGQTELQSICDTLPHLVEAEILRLRQPAVVKHQPQVVDGFVDLPRLPELNPLPGEVNLVWDLIMKILPQRKVTLSGILRQDTPNGWGLQVRLIYEQSKELLASQFIWQHAVDPEKKKNASELYPDLAMAAAVWTCWILHAWEKHEGMSCVEARCTELRAAYGTDSWRSHVAVQQGRRLLDSDSAAAPQAEALFRQALDKDPKNWQALLVLAGVMLDNLLADEKQRREPEAYQKLWSYIETAKKESPSKLPQPGSKEMLWNPIHIIADFKLGQVALYRYLAAGWKREHIEQAEQCFGRAAKEVKRSNRFTDVARRTMRAAHAVSLRIKGDSLAAASIVQELEEQAWLPASVRYNLACYYSSESGELKVKPSAEDYQKADEHLIEACRSAKSYEELAKTDPSLGNLLDWRRRKEAGIPPAPQEASASTGTRG